MRGTVERGGESMEPGDFFEPEVAVTAAVVAAICSPRVRKFVRRGLVYGTAGALIAGDAVTSFAKNVGKGARQAGVSMAQAAQEGVQQANETPSSIHKNQYAPAQKANRGRTGAQEQGGETEWTMLTRIIQGWQPQRVPSKRLTPSDIVLVF
jgi:hypothetical protein